HPVATWQAVAAAGLLAAVTAGALWQAERRPYLAGGWLWYLGTLVPGVGLGKQGEQAMAGRFTYIPRVRLGILVVWGIASIVPDTSRARARLAAAAVAALAACALATRAQLAHWRSSVTLFTRALAVTRDNALAHMNLAVALEADGRRDEALAH